MFTGIDLIVILMVFGVIFYTMQPDSGKGNGGLKLNLKVEPLTLLVIMIVAAMVVGSML